MNPDNLLKLTKIILSLKTKVKCPICLDFVENAVQLGCAHQFCSSCLHELKLQISSVCPLCKVPINKRSAVYKDHFADDLSKFVDRTCQLIKETYAHEVEELNTNNDKLQDIIDTAPQYVNQFPTNSKAQETTEFGKPAEVAFNRLIGQPRCYTNKKKPTEQRGNPKVLSFNDTDNKTKIINWLNDNQLKLDTLTQTPSILMASDDEADFELPSISQVAYLRKQKPSNRVRSQSLNLANNLNEPLVKRYHSLTQGLNEDDYDIEEVHSETLVKQVERKVLQNMLEDQCLANLEHIAEQDKNKAAKEKVTPKKGRKSVSKNKNCDIPDSGSSSGWDRIKDVKKSIKKATKEPKKLNISLQETSSTRKAPKGDRKESPVQKTSAKVKQTPKGPLKGQPTEKATTKIEKSIKGTTVENKENEICHKKADPKPDIPQEQATHTFNLSTVENYFKHNIENIKLTPDKNTSSDMEIDVINSSPTKLKDSSLQNRNSAIKQITVQKDKSFDEEIFTVPTQITPQSENQKKTICYVAPVSKELNDIDSIAVRLTDNLGSCIFSATNLNNEIADSLIECFTNLKTYIDKIQKHRSDKKEQDMQTSRVNVVMKETTAVQTETVSFLCKEAQTDQPLVKKLSTKLIQTSQNRVEDAEIQTNPTKCVDQEVQATELSTRRFIREKSVEKIIRHTVRYSLSPPDISKDGQGNKHTKETITTSTQLYNVEKPEDEEKFISRKTSQSSSTDNQEKHISEDSSKKSKTKSRDASQDSLLICSVEPTASNKSNKKINRKLSYEETQNRSFKRIRRPASDSESDDDKKPNKRRLVRDDLTVEFLDTERGSKDDTPKKTPSSPESEKMDYDKYLLEVMAKYGTPPPDKTSGDKEQFRHDIKSTRLSTTKKQDSQRSQNSQKRKSESSKKESQKLSGDHVFTANVAFEKNLEKFDKEIFEYEHEHTTKVHSSEYDLVENTPLLSPKAKISRLQAPSNKDERKKDCMKKPFQILSKGSASSNTSKKKEPLDDDSLSELTQREPFTLDRNIDKVPTQTEKCTDDVAGILYDLRNDADFFKSNMDCEERDRENDLSRRQEKQFPLGGGSKDDKTSDDVLNVTQENIDKVVESLTGFDDGDDMEAELEKISFSAEQRKLTDVDRNRVKILQNIKLKSQDKKVAESPFNPVIDSSDVSDEEIVETTPQKKKHSSKDRPLDNLKENSLDTDDLEFWLPPPPGFGDEVQNSPTRESPVNDQDFHPVEGSKLSLTPDSLTDFIVTPDTTMYKETAAAQNENSHHSISFKPAVPSQQNRVLKDKSTPLRNAPRFSQILPTDPGEIFSPITKSTIKFSQPKYTPLVSTSRLTTRKPSLMTSTPNQKSILNYVKPSQDGASSQQKPKPCIMWSRIVNKDLNVFTQLEVKKLVTTSTSFNPRVTHLVVLVDEKGQIVSHTAKILIAIAAGIWVVRYEWAQDCLKQNRIVPEEPYEALDATGVPGPQISRFIRETKPLFKGFRFYCAAPILTIPKGELKNILELSGGEVARNLEDFLQDDEKVNIILTESSASEDTEQFENLLQIYKAVTVDVEWLTKCIAQYKLVSFRAFLVSGDDSNICDLGYPPILVESVPFTLTDAM